MQENLMTSTYQRLKKLLVYQPPQLPTPFILDEAEREDNKSGFEVGQPPLPKAAHELELLISYAHRLEDFITKTKETFSRVVTKEDIEQLARQVEILEQQHAEVAPVYLSYTTGIDPLERPIGVSLDENKKIIQEIYQMPANKEVLFREFEIPGKKPIKAMLVFIDGLVDKKLINTSVLQSLMLFDGTKEEVYGEKLVSALVAKYLPTNEAKRIHLFRDLANEVSAGDTALLLDGVSEAIIISTKGYSQRGLSTPNAERSVRGSQVAFSEGLKTNTSLIRVLMPDSDLVTEIIEVGKRAPLKCAIMYLHGVANPDLVAEVKRRISSISTDYVSDLGVLEQMIEDHPNIPFPQSLSTERPDRTVAHLAEGRIAILLQGTPFAHIVPINFFSFFHSIEDFSLKSFAGSFMRILRMLGALISIVLPSAYLAINYFHQEALPTEIVLAIAGAREKVPFPALVEILMMEFSFEFIREAGLRVPGLLGSTIGIVGALILGQAAVTANIVSPIMVVIIAITGLASFTIPDYRLGIGLRLTRFVFLALGATFGLVGLAFGLLIGLVMLCSMKSFGVPYMAPIAPKTMRGGFDVVLRGPVYEQEERPDELNTKNRRRQQEISRRWILEKPVGKGE